MNFLLYMIGRGSGRGNSGIGEGNRPGIRETLIARAATHAGDGRLDEALSIYRQLGEITDENVMDVLIQGHLHLALGHKVFAQDCFANGMELVLDHGDAGGGAGGDAGGESPGEGSDTSIERWISKAEYMLGLGGYSKATRYLRRARALIDVVLSAEGGLLLAQDDTEGLPRLASLARLSDLTLRMLARTQLARQLAGALRERHLREDLAAWATSRRSVMELLEKEVERFAEVARELPGHAETSYRLGLVACAAGQLDLAAQAFERVLLMHPQHVASAVRLTVIRAERGVMDLNVLQKAFRVPVKTLQSFGAFALLAGEEKTFDAAALKLGGTDADRTTAQGNLAFALSELGLLDGSREHWREIVHA